MTDQKVLRFHDGEMSIFCRHQRVLRVLGQRHGRLAGRVQLRRQLRLRPRRPTQGARHRTFHAEPPPSTNLIVLDPEGEIIQVIPDMDFPNGMVITPDGRHSSSVRPSVRNRAPLTWRADGTLSNRRVWAPIAGVTDGMCLDADGQIWFANAISHECLRVREGGEITGTVTCSQHAYACMLGGEDGRTLFIMTCTSSDRFEIADKTTVASSRCGSRSSTPARRRAQPSFVSALRRLRTACAVRSSFSINAKRTCVSPPSPKPTPGLVATSADSMRNRANSSEPISR